MLYYHFTNNFRIDTFEENLIAIARYQKYGIWEHQTITNIEQIKKETFQAYELYFGLGKNSNNADLTLDGELDEVVDQFKKKFQFPNPRRTVGEKSYYTLEVENKQLLAPTRVLLQ